MKRARKSRGAGAFFEKLARAAIEWAGGSWAFGMAVLVILVWGLTGPDLRLFGHLAARHQHGHDHRHVPDGVPHPAGAEQGVQGHPAQAERNRRRDPGGEQPPDRRRGPLRARRSKRCTSTTASWRGSRRRRATSSSPTPSRKRGTAASPSRGSVASELLADEPGATSRPSLPPRAPDEGRSRRLF